MIPDNKYQKPIDLGYLVITGDCFCVTSLHIINSTISFQIPLRFAAKFYVSRFRVDHFTYKGGQRDSYQFWGYENFNFSNIEFGPLNEFVSLTASMIFIIFYRFEIKWAEYVFFIRIELVLF